MKIKIRSAYDDKELEQEINKVIAKAEDNDYYLDSIEYSTTYDETHGDVLRSALIVFEEYSDDDEDDEDDED
jgi:hypothetical protein